MSILFPFICSALIPGLGQLLLKDFFKGLLMLLIPILFGVFIDQISIVYPYCVSVIWSVTDIYLKTEKKEGRAKAIKNLIFSIVVIIVVIPAIFYLFIISTKSGGEMVVDNFFNEGRTKEEMTEITNQLGKYYSYYKKYPADIDEFINSKPIWNNWKTDAWGNRYKYRTSDSTKFILISAGKDKQFDTQDDIIQQNN